MLFFNFYIALPSSPDILQFNHGITEVLRPIANGAKAFRAYSSVHGWYVINDHANVSKQTTLLADVDIAPPNCAA